jgi:hypothetical protein
MKFRLPDQSSQVEKRLTFDSVFNILSQLSGSLFEFLTAEEVLLFAEETLDFIIGYFSTNEDIISHSKRNPDKSIQTNYKTGMVESRNLKRKPPRVLPRQTILLNDLTEVREKLTIARNQLITGKTTLMSLDLLNNKQSSELESQLRVLSKQVIGLQEQLRVSRKQRKIQSLRSSYKSNKNRNKRRN